ncbi:hypothetical protein D3C86_1474670 [compost metagenome]
MQGRDHFSIAAAQRLRFKVIKAFTQLPEELFEAGEEAFALSIHFFAFVLLDLVYGDEQAAGHQ